MPDRPSNDQTLHNNVEEDIWADELSRFGNLTDRDGDTQTLLLTTVPSDLLSRLKLIRMTTQINERRLKNGQRLRTNREY
jgi:hypothetical protein